jgi:hypothetical protein
MTPSALELEQDVAPPWPAPMSIDEVLRKATARAQEHGISPFTSWAFILSAAYWCAVAQYVGR